MNKRIEFGNGTTRTVENLLGWIPINEEYCRKEEQSNKSSNLRAFSEGVSKEVFTKGQEMNHYAIQPKRKSEIARK